MTLPRIILYILSFLILAVPALSGDKVRIVTEQLPPFNYMEDGEIRGISTTVVEAAFKRAGVEYVIEVEPWRRAVEDTDTNPNTFIYTMARTPKREDKYIWVGKLFDRKVSLFRHRYRSDLDGLSPVALHTQTKVCAINGDASLELLQQVGFTESSIHKVNDSPIAICPRMVQEGRADLTPYNPYVLAYRIRNGELVDMFSVHSVLLNEDGYYLAANPKSDPKLIKKLMQAFKELAAEGFNDKVESDYLGY